VGCHSVAERSWPHLERLSVTDGLNQGTVNTILKDRRGYLWFGTGNGINIYDGAQFRSLAGPDKELERHEVYQIREDKQGRIWFTASGQGLYVYEPLNDTYQHILRNDPVDPALLIYHSLPHIEGESDWLVTNKTVGLYHQANGSFEQKVDLRSYLVGYDYIYTAKQYDGLLLIGTRAGFFVYDINSKLFKKISISGLKNQSKKPEKVFDFQLLNGVLYLGTGNGLFKISWSSVIDFMSSDKQTLNIELVYPDVEAWILTIQNEILLISTRKGLFQFNPKNKSGKNILNFSSFFDDVGNNSISSILVDNEGLYWMGSETSGVYYTSSQSNKIKSYAHGKGKGGLSNNVVTAVLAQDDMIWVATDNGLNALDVSSDKIEQYLVSDDSDGYGNIFEINEYESYLFLSTYDGVIAFDKKTRKVVPLPFGKKVIEILSKEDIYYTHIIDSNMWLVSETGDYVLNLKRGSIERLSEIESVIGVNSIWRALPSFNNDPDKVLFSTNDVLWSYNHKLKKIAPLVEFPDVPENEEIYIDSYIVDKSGTIWLAYTGVGIVALDPKSMQIVRTFNKENSSINTSVYGITFDKLGNIWFSSNDGLYRISADNHHIRKFSLADGMVGGEFNGGASGKTPNGQLVFGGMRGVSVFDPAALEALPTKHNFEVAVTKISIMSRDLSIPPFNLSGDPIVLDYNDVGIRVHFSSFTYLYQDLVLYRYELAGESDVSSSYSRDNSVTFSRLSPGNHQLTIFAVSPFTGEEVASLPVSFVVEHAPWETPLAKITYLISALLIIFMFALYRYRRKVELFKAHEEVKARENTLKLALSGSNSEVWDWTSRDNKLFQKRIFKDLKSAPKNTSISLDEHISLIHRDDRNLYLDTWNAFVSSKHEGENFNCTYRMIDAQGEWLWYRDLGKAVEWNQSGEVLRVTGSYTNITQGKADEEKAQHYGDAFKQTKDWVFMVDEKFSRVTVNPSLCKLFSFDEEEFVFDSNFLGVSRERRGFYQKILGSLKDIKHWSGEDLITTPEGDKYHVLVSISKSVSSTGSMHYIFVMTDVSSLKNAENKLRKMAIYDDLTGLPNRSLLIERIEHGIQKATRQKVSLALMFVDLDRFKSVNDSLGHFYGDLLLKEVASRLTECLREDDTVARIGGDEFVILIEQFKSNKNLSHIAQKIIEAIGAPIRVKDHVVSVGSSIGISVYPDDSLGQESLLRNADVAMYNAKQNGRNGYKFFTAAMNEEAKYRLAIEHDLKLAAKNDDFYNLYQPQVDSVTGEIVGVEMLMRWEKGGEQISPHEFIPVAEELGIITSMTDKALNKAFHQLERWRRLSCDFSLAVNVSAPHFSDASLVEYIVEKLEQYGVEPQSLELEVTEGVFIENPDEVIETMTRLSKVGVKMALDDFGTGFSSLAYLKRLPLDIVKIDRGFVSGIGVEKADEAIIDATLVLAKSLGVICVAEGVETEAQLKYLRDKKCHLVQGYYYYPPMRADEITELIKTS